MSDKVTPRAASVFSPQILPERSPRNLPHFADLRDGGNLHDETFEQAAMTWLDRVTRFALVASLAFLGVIIMLKLTRVI